MAFEVYSLPLSLTIILGRPRPATSLSSSLATRMPERDVSTTSARHSRVQSSTTARMRKRRPSVNWSDTKSSDQRWSGRSGTSIGALVPNARLRPPRRRTASLLLPIEPEQLLVVHDEALALQHHEKTPVAEP